MSLMDKLKSIFSGGSSDTADAHAGHDNAGHDHSNEPDAPPLPAADVAETATEEDENSPA